MGALTHAGNALPAQHQLENNDPTEQMDEARGTYCYQLHVNTKYGTHEHP